MPSEHRCRRLYFPHLPRPRKHLLLVALGIAIAASGFIALFRSRNSTAAPELRLEPAVLLATGHDRATLTVVSNGPEPQILIAGESKNVQVEPPEAGHGVWRSEVVAGVLPGEVSLQVLQPGHRAARISLQLRPQTSDAAGDGTPDFLRLENEQDERAFRGWFAFLAEVQYFLAPGKRSSEIADCSALVRYAYREALRRHDAHWSAGSSLPLIPAMNSVSKYSFPNTLLGSNLFRVRPGPYVPADLLNGAFAQFADAETLQRFNTHLVSRDVRRAVRGDLLFFRRQTEHLPYHSMIFIGKSQIESSTDVYVVYHTGPEGTNSGEIRRLSIEQLLRYPDPQWQAIATNPTFLGVFRWNILKTPS